MSTKGSRSGGYGAESQETPLGDAQGTPTAGQVMGFGGQLRAWRKAAGRRRGRVVTQEEVARAILKSERWYRDLERGATARRLDREQCDNLADLLQLDRDEHHALLLYNQLNTADPDAGGDSRVRSALRLLVDKQMPDPTYLCDAKWNILAYNQAMAEWWPWVMEPGANLMRWALTSQEARVQYHDWHQHVAAYVRMLKYALAGHGDDPELLGLIGDVCKDADVARIWEGDAGHSVNRDGHVFKMSLPALGWETVDVVSHVLYPASLPDCRLVVITWWSDEGDTETDPLGGARNAWTENANPEMPTSTPAESLDDASRRRIANSLTKRPSVVTAEEAAALAGDDGVHLPVLSAMIGPDTQLTLSPSTHSVIWAVRDADGQWGISEVDAYTVIVRVPHAAINKDARREMMLLTRTVLPAEPKEAIDRIQQLVPQLKQRIQLLEAIHRDLWEADNTLPYVWDPTDEL
ncbi:MULTISPECIES: helix-turn-helix transcriptional regulator [Streptomyces]|uniref:Transcriptional regulator n=1 Tax=Streptomyces venezuelae TaxID=54571 RepID=A0A5P2ALF5_STRVZ|nr:helix-turn-helix transcriptional regulator [Streptomyces venezuelae]QES18667.1 transcriptional regulator [Streptomyces venezuelae]